MIRRYLESFMSQNWEDLILLHWRYPVDDLRKLIPSELQLDLFDGQAWLSVVGFRLTNLKINPIGMISWKDFDEVNLRTYVKDSFGNRGVWFFSLDSNDLMSVIGARGLYGLNYRFATIDNQRTEKSISYFSRTSRLQGSVEARISGTILSGKTTGEGSKKGTLNHFLLERYRFWSKRYWHGRLSSARVKHQPYDAIQLTDGSYQGGLFKSFGICEPNRGPSLGHYCKGFRVEAEAPVWAFGIAGHANQV